MARPLKSRLVIFVNLTRLVPSVICPMLKISLPLSPLKLIVVMLSKTVKELVPVDVLKLNVSALLPPLKVKVLAPSNNVVIDELDVSLKLNISTPVPPVIVAFVKSFGLEVSTLSIEPVALKVAPVPSRPKFKLIEVF